MGAMRVRTFAILSALWVVVPRTAEARPEGAGDIATREMTIEAQVRFRRALDLYEEGDLQAARVELQRAHEASPNFKVLYNLGQVEFELHDYPAALVTFEHYLEQGGVRVPPSRRVKVEADLLKLRGRVAFIDIRVNVADADIAIDDLPVGRSPSSSHAVVSAGRRKIVVTHSGYVTETHWLDVAGGDRVALDCELREISAPRLPERPERARAVETRPPVQEVDPSSTPWFGWVATGVLASGAAVSAGLAIRASQQLGQERVTLGIERDALDERKRQVDRLAIVTDVLIGAALVSGSASLYFALARRGKSDVFPLRISAGLGSFCVSGAF